MESSLEANSLLVLREQRKEGRVIYEDVSLADTAPEDLFELLKELNISDQSVFYLLPGYKDNEDDKGFNLH